MHSSTRWSMASNDVRTQVDTLLSSDGCFQAERKEAPVRLDRVVYPPFYGDSATRGPPGVNPPLISVVFVQDRHPTSDNRVRRGGGCLAVQTGHLRLEGMDSSVPTIPKGARLDGLARSETPWPWGGKRRRKVEGRFDGRIVIGKV